MRKEVVVASSDGGRIDSFLSAELNMSRSAVTRLLEDGNVMIESKPVKKNVKVKTGDIIEIFIPDPKELDIKAQDIPLDIVFEDRNLLVVNKPKGMVVHPAPGNPDRTLVNALLKHCEGGLSGINGVLRPGIVHRIDKDTSGLLMVAKDDETHRGLAAQIKEHSFLREYEAVVVGNIRAEKGKIDAPIGRHPVKRKQMAVTDKNSKDAVTHYEVIARYAGFTHVRLRLETGRTHQIRVHMSYIGHPIAGDTVYGSKKAMKGLSGQCLHAKKVGFVHPIGNEWLEFDSDLPDYFKDFLRSISK